LSVTISKSTFYALFGLVIVSLMVGGAALATVLYPAAQMGRTQHIKIIMGEGEVIAEVQGEDVVSGEYHRWEPNTIVVHQGDRVVLEIVNPRKAIHSFALPAFGINTGPLEPRGGSATIEFVADEAGVFQFLCATPHDHALNQCDPDHDTMVGYFVVLQG